MNSFKIRFPAKGVTVTVQLGDRMEYLGDDEEVEETYVLARDPSDEEGLVWVLQTD